MCLSCELLMDQANFERMDRERGSEEIPTEWRTDLDRLERLMSTISKMFGKNVIFELFDPRSPQGLLKSIRYRIHKYPGFIIEKRSKYCGWDTNTLVTYIEAAGAVRQ